MMTQSAKMDRKVDREEIAGHEHDVDTFVKAKKAAAKAVEKVAALRAPLGQLVDAKRARMLNAGVFTKVFTLLGTKLNATFTYADAYPTALTVERAAEARKVVGEAFDHFFAKKTETKVRKGKMAALATHLGDQAADFLEETELYAPVDQAQERVFEARKELDPSQWTALWLLLDSIMATASLRTT